MTRRRWMLWGAAVALLAGCGAEVHDGPYEGAPPKGESLGEMRQQAGEALARYDQAVLAAADLTTVDVTPPPWKSPPGISIEAATGVRTGTRLTVTFTGAAGPATEPCGVDYRAEAVESANAVVVIVIAQPYATDEACLLSGHPRTATLELARPLGARVVLEARQGLPVLLTTG
ncbi:hypothetical protein ACIBO1_30370 [Micromonospora sp. NPDC049903]|uniref:hypothetical protein n=1 Tax=Micromonospora sp. NPDC049903 TaxID=3364276 RepID=UPI00378AE1A2